MFWLTIPGLAILTKMAEYLNSHPTWFITGQPSTSAASDEESKERWEVASAEQLPKVEYVYLNAKNDPGGKAELMKKVDAIELAARAHGLEPHTEIMDKRSSSSGVLRVNLRSASDLMIGDTNGLSDPYCKISIAGATQTSKTKYKTLNPEWNETLEFKGTLSTFIENDLTLEFMDYDLLESDDLLGELTMSLDALREEDFIPVNKKLDFKKVKLEKTKGREEKHGNVTFEVTWVPDKEPDGQVADLYAFVFLLVELPGQSHKHIRFKKLSAEVGLAVEQVAAPSLLERAASSAFSVAGAVQKRTSSTLAASPALGAVQRRASSILERRSSQRHDYPSMSEDSLEEGVMLTASLRSKSSFGSLPRSASMPRSTSLLRSESLSPSASFDDVAELPRSQSLSRSASMVVVDKAKAVAKVASQIINSTQAITNQDGALCEVKFECEAVLTGKPTWKYVVPGETRALGSKWKAVGGEEPKEGNEITNEALSEALSKALKNRQQQFERLPLEVSSNLNFSFTQVEIEEFKLLNLKTDSFINVSDALGSKWKVGDDKPKKGNEITNEALSKALLEKHEFNRAEIEGFKLNDLKFDSFIKVGNKYFEQAAGEGDNYFVLDTDKSMWTEERKFSLQIRLFPDGRYTMRAPNFYHRDANKDGAFNMQRFLYFVDVLKVIALYIAACGLTQLSSRYSGMVALRIIAMPVGFKRFAIWLKKQYELAETLIRLTMLSQRLAKKRKGQPGQSWSKRIWRANSCLRPLWQLCCQKQQTDEDDEEVSPDPGFSIEKWCSHASAFARLLSEGVRKLPFLDPDDLAELFVCPVEVPNLESLKADLLDRLGSALDSESNEQLDAIKAVLDKWVQRMSKELGYNKMKRARKKQGSLHLHLNPHIFGARWASHESSVRPVQGKQLKGNQLEAYFKDISSYKPIPSDVRLRGERVKLTKTLHFDPYVGPFPLEDRGPGTEQVYYKPRQLDTPGDREEGSKRLHAVRHMLAASSVVMAPKSDRAQAQAPGRRFQGALKRADERKRPTFNQTIRPKASDLSALQKILSDFASSVKVIVTSKPAPAKREALPPPPLQHRAWSHVAVTSAAAGDVEEAFVDTAAGALPPHELAEYTEAANQTARRMRSPQQGLLGAGSGSGETAEQVVNADVHTDIEAAGFRPNDVRARMNLWRV